MTDLCKTNRSVCYQTCLEAQGLSEFKVPEKTLSFLQKITKRHLGDIHNDNIRAVSVPNAWSNFTSYLKTKWYRFLLNCIAWRHKKTIPFYRSTNTVKSFWIGSPEPSTVPGNVQIMLYIHGGSGISGSTALYRPILQTLYALKSKEPALSKLHIMSIDYRLAPEHPFPAGLRDTVNTFLWLTRRYPQAPIYLVGDSMGGNLALGTLLYLSKNRYTKLPAKIIALSPPVDFTPFLLSQNVVQTSTDWIHPNAENAVQTGYHYFGSKRFYGKTRTSKEYLKELLKWCSHPYVSVARADWSTDSHLKEIPILLQVGSSEVLYDTLVAFVQHLRSSGFSNIQLTTYKDMFHDFQLFGLEPSCRALSSLIHFLTLR